MNTVMTHPRRTGRRLGFGLMALSLLAVVAAAVIFAALHTATSPPLHLWIDGEQVLDGFDLRAWPPEDKLVFALCAAAGLMVALVVTLVVVPVALCIAAGAVVVALLLGLGLPIVAVLVVSALVLSPLLLLAMVVVWLWKWGTKPTTIRG